jgi:ferredoxin
VFHAITEDCIVCDACPRECPVGAIESGARRYKIVESACLDCGACVPVCPTGAIVRRAGSDAEVRNGWAQRRAAVEFR